MLTFPTRELQAGREIFRSHSVSHSTRGEVYSRIPLPSTKFDVGSKIDSKVDKMTPLLYATPDKLLLLH